MKAVEVRVLFWAPTMRSAVVRGSSLLRKNRPIRHRRGPGDVDQEDTARQLSDGRDKRSCDQVETAASFAPVILGYAQSLDSTLFFRGISFCSNGPGRRRKPDSRQQ